MTSGTCQSSGGIGTCCRTVCIRRCTTSSGVRTVAKLSLCGHARAGRWLVAHFTVLEAARWSGFSAWKHGHMLVSAVLHTCREWCFKYSAFTEKLPTRAFLVPLDEDEEIEASLSQGVNVRLYVSACTLRVDFAACTIPLCNPCAVCACCAALLIHALHTSSKIATGQWDKALRWKRADCQNVCCAPPQPQVSIKFKAVSEPQPNGKVDVFFEVNGVPRVVEVAVSAKAAAASGSECCRDAPKCWICGRKQPRSFECKMGLEHDVLS